MQHRLDEFVSENANITDLGQLVAHFHEFLVTRQFLFVFPSRRSISIRNAAIQLEACCGAAGIGRKV